MLSNIGFDGPPTVCIVGHVTVCGIIDCIEWLPYFRRLRGSIDGDVCLVHLKQWASSIPSVEFDNSTQKKKKSNLARVRKCILTKFIKI